MLYSSLLSTFFFIILCNGGQKLCNNPHECADQTFTSSTDEFLCFGSYSCDNALIHTTDPINCNGYFACNGAQKLETNAWIWCRGYAGCAHSKDTIQADNFIYCTGDESCYNSNVRSGTNVKCRGNSACVFGVLFSDGIIECDGPQSCKNAQITGAVIGCHSMESCSDADITSYGPLTIFGYRGAYRASIGADIIYGRGYGALQCATIDSSDRLSMNVVSTGSYSGVNTDIICRSGSTCNLSCGSSGCYALNFYCLQGSICTVNLSGCKQNNGGIGDNDNGINCPNWRVSKSNNDDVLFIGLMAEPKDIHAGFGC